MAITAIPLKDIKSIISTVNITSPLHVIKELIENSIDSFDDNGSSDTKLQIVIEIDLATGGLDYISVKDNGSGVEKRDRMLMCHNHCTSKITSYSDLENGISTLGFRGEALFHITQQGNVTITTRTRDEKMGEKWYADRRGDTSAMAEAVVATIGTNVTVRQLFHHLPVRKKFFKKDSRKTLSSLYDLIVSYSLCHRNIRFDLKHIQLSHKGESVVKTSVPFNPDLPALKLFCHLLKVKESQLFEIDKSFTTSDSKGNSYMVRVLGIFPRTRAQDNFLPRNPFKVLTVNGRPLSTKLGLGKNVSSLVTKAFTENLVLAPNAWYLGLSVPKSEVDINIEPEKLDVLISNVDQFLVLLKELLISHVTEIHNHRLPTEEVTEGIDGLGDSLSTPAFKRPCTITNRAPSEVKASKCSYPAQDFSTEEPERTNITGQNLDSQNTLYHSRVNGSTDSQANLSTFADDWSFTMCSTTSSDDILPSSLAFQNEEEEDITIVEDINISNPFTITKMKGKKTFPMQFIAPGPMRKKNNQNPPPKSPAKPLKQSIIWRSQPQEVESILLTENMKPSSNMRMMSEDTLCQDTTISVSKLDKKINSTSYTTEIQWVTRKGFPSSALLDGYCDLIMKLEGSVSRPKVGLQKLDEGWFSASFTQNLD